MSILADRMSRFGLPVSEVEVADAVEAGLLGGYAAPSSAPLGADAAAFLREHAGLDPNVLDGGPGALRAMRVASVGAYAAMLGESLTTGQAADRLGIAASRVRHRIAARQLYAIRVGPRTQLLPSWQFLEDRPVPGLAQVLASLPVDLHPLELAAFLLEPSDALPVGGRPLSPRDWLAGGGEVEAVLALAGGLTVPA